MATYRLPLNALRAFEASVRLKSMSAAAVELGVTHGAISRHVRSLENEYGLPLLRRLPKSVEPTSQGRQLASAVRRAFDDHFYLQIQAAACGLGVAIAPQILVEGEIRRGHLVAPFGFVAGPHELNLWIAPHLRHRSDVRRLAGWIEREMQSRGE